MRTQGILMIALLALAAPSWAADPAAPPVQQQQHKSTVPHAEEIVAMAKELAKELNETQAKALSDIRNAFGVIQAIAIVRKDVEMAAAQCGEKNRDMADDIAKEQTEWKGAIDPPLTEQQKILDGAVDKVDFPNRNKVKSYLALIEKSANKANETLDKTIVTTPDACRGLIETMQKTQDTLVKALTDIKWPEDKTQARTSRQKEGSDSSKAGEEKKEEEKKKAY